MQRLDGHDPVWPNARQQLHGGAATQYDHYNLSPLAGVPGEQAAKNNQLLASCNIHNAQRQ